MKSFFSIATAFYASSAFVADAFAPIQHAVRRHDILTHATTTSLFLFGKGAKSSSSKFTDEALELYRRVNPGRGREPYFFESWGMPQSYAEIDYTAADNIDPFFQVDDAKLRATFSSISKLYGEENALKMVQVQPNILAFNKDYFEPSLKNFGEIFGVDEAKAMVMRNPGLLSTNPESAAKADNLTMQLSYVVEVTRPLGLGGLVFVLSLLSVPVLEGVTGVSRSQFIDSLLN